MPIRCLPANHPAFLFHGGRDLLGHEDISTTEIYLHVAKGVGAMGVKSPLDRLVEVRGGEDE